MLTDTAQWVLSGISVTALLAFIVGLFLSDYRALKKRICSKVCEDDCKDRRDALKDKIMLEVRDREEGK